ncbi:hypothetical protein ACF3NG_02885 [Aerococcaceae bacterium WGS1372]
MIKRTRRLFATLPVLFMVVSLSYGSYSLVQASESDISENVLESISESTEEDDEVSEVASESESSDAGVSAKESEESTEEEASDALDMMTEIDSSEDTYDMNEELTIEDGALDYETPAYLLNPRDISLYPTEYEGVTIKHIEGEYMNGFHMIPDEKLYKGTIVVFGGSEGSPSYDLAVGFASAGYEVFSMFFFGMENQQAELAEVPLDFFKKF